MVGAFDPGDDRDAEFLSGVPARAVKDGLLQQREEALHGGVVPGGPDAAHGADHVVATQGENEFPASKLTAPVAMDDAAGDIAAVGYRVGQGLGGQPRLHAGVDAVADDAAGELVLDRAQVELAFAGAVFGDIGQPQCIWRWGGEDPADQIVVDRRAGLAVLSALALAEGTPPLVLRADPPCRALGHRLPGLSGFLEQVAVSEVGVIFVGVERGVGPMRLGDLGGGRRNGQPAVVGLAGELEYPARHRHGDPVGGELLHERVEPFPGRLACDR